MSKLKCGCVIADAKNTSSVRNGYEMGGYVKTFCADHARSDEQAMNTAHDSQQQASTPSAEALLAQAHDAEKRIGMNVWRGDGRSHIFIGCLIADLRKALEAAIARAEKEREYTDALAVSHQAEVDELNAKLAESQSQADALRAEVERKNEALDWIISDCENCYWECACGRDPQMKDTDLYAEARRGRAYTGTDKGNGGLKPKEGV